MISRDEAKTDLYIEDRICNEKDGMMSTYDADKIIDKIYDSITKCGECKYSENIMIGELEYAKCSLFPAKGNVDVFELDEFCSKGEPR